MKEISRIDSWKNYDIRITFKEGKNKDMQMLIFLNDELAYATKYGSFKYKNYTVQNIKFNKLIPRYVTEERTKLVWNNDRERNRFTSWCKKFKLSTCRQLQEQCTIALSKVV